MWVSTHTHTHTHIHTHTHTLSLSHTHTHTYSLSHTHSHTHTHIFFGLSNKMNICCWRDQKYINSLPLVSVHLSTAGVQNGQSSLWSIPTEPNISTISIIVSRNVLSIIFILIFVCFYAEWKTPVRPPGVCFHHSVCVRHSCQHSIYKSSATGWSSQHFSTIICKLLIREQMGFSKATFHTVRIMYFFLLHSKYKLILPYFKVLHHFWKLNATSTIQVLCNSKLYFKELVCFAVIKIWFLNNK